MEATELADDGGALLGAIPEEEHTLAEFLVRTLGRGNRLERVGMHTRVPGFRADGHRSGREVLHLFQLEIQLLGFGCQFGHILLRTSRMRGDEVGNQLLPQPRLATDAVENALEVVEEFKRWLAHES